MANENSKWGGITLTDAVGRMIEASGTPVKAITAAYDAASYEVEKFASEAARQRDTNMALPSLRPEQTPHEWWKFWR